MIYQQHSSLIVTVSIFLGILAGGVSYWYWTNSFVAFGASLGVLLLSLACLLRLSSY